MISQAIHTVKQHGRKIGICGQAPSDYPEFARFLVEQGIDSISLNPDSVLKTLLEVADAEAISTLVLIKKRVSQTTAKSGQNPS
jgi:pyruvate,water dikinase